VLTTEDRDSASVRPVHVSPSSKASHGRRRPGSPSTQSPGHNPQHGNSGQRRQTPWYYPDRPFAISPDRPDNHQRNPFRPSPILRGPTRTTTRPDSPRGRPADNDTRPPCPVGLPPKLRGGKGRGLRQRPWQ